MFPEVLTKMKEFNQVSNIAFAQPTGTKTYWPFNLSHKLSIIACIHFSWLTESLTLMLTPSLWPYFLQILNSWCCEPPTWIPMIIFTTPSTWTWTFKYWILAYPNRLIWLVLWLLVLFFGSSTNPSFQIWHHEMHPCPHLLHQQSR